jgi:hypothetical protein
MTNADIERYNLPEKDKSELRYLRNIRRKMKRRGRKLPYAVNGMTTLREVNKRILELQKNGAVHG